MFAQQPVILNWCFYGVLLTNYALNTAWIFVWLYELITAATILLLFIAYTGWIAFAIACYRYIPNNLLIFQINFKNQKIIIQWKYGHGEERRWGCQKGRFHRTAFAEDYYSQWYRTVYDMVHHCIGII